MKYVEPLNIDKIKRKMLVKYPFFGSVVSSVQFKDKDGIGTAGTDGKTIYYDPEFLSELSEDEQSFLFAHEICHIVFNHILRSENKNPKIWNMATDAVINQFLIKDGLPLIKDGVNISDAINYDAEMLYYKLLKKEQEQKERNKQKGNEKNAKNSNDLNHSESDNSTGDNDEQRNEQNSNKNSINNTDEKQNEEQNFNNQEDLIEQQEHNGTKSNDVGHDTHELWEEAVKKSKEDQKNNDEIENNNISQLLEETAEILNSKSNQISEKDLFKINEKIKKEQLEDLINNLTKDFGHQGMESASQIRNIKNIGTNKPLIDWRLWLREAISMDVDWSYQNAEIENGVIKPNLDPYLIPETEILLDTSGSINENLLKNFLYECKNILKTSRVKVGCFDTKFYDFNEIKSIDDIDNLEYIGGGGTDFNVAINAFTKKVENKIVFTDGDSTMPDIITNVIWVVFGGKEIKPMGGIVIYISDEQLKKLCYAYDSNDAKKSFTKKRNFR